MSSVTLTELRVICESTILSQKPQLSKPDNLDGKNLKKIVVYLYPFSQYSKGFLPVGLGVWVSKSSWTKQNQTTVSYGIIIQRQSCAIRLKACFPAVSSSNQIFLINMQAKNALSNIGCTRNCFEIPNKGKSLTPH